MELVGVKDLVEARVSKVPGEYVMDLDPQQHCSHINTLPVIDLSDIEKGSSGRQVAVESIRSASKEWGFFQIINHGFPEDVAASMAALVHEFFQLPREERNMYYSEDTSRKFRFGTSFLPDKQRLWQDALFQMCNPPCDARELPTKPSSYAEVSTTFGKKMNSLAKMLLGLFSESLGLESGALEAAFGGERHAMRMNYYPPCPEPELTLGLAAHSDPNGFTVLLQDTSVEEGLQVRHSGAWVPIKPLPGAFVVNIGDQMQILSNDAYKSVEHRAVVNRERTRVSIASFYGPAEEKCIAPVAELVSDDTPARFKPSVYGDYLRQFYSKKLDGKTAFDTLRIS